MFTTCYTSLTRFLYIQLGLDDYVSKIGLDLDDVHDGYVCISTAHSKQTRKGYYTFLIREAKQIVMALGYRGVYSVSRSEQAQLFWDKFSKQNQVTRKQNAYFY